MEFNWDQFNDIYHDLNNPDRLDIIISLIYKEINIDDITENDGIYRKLVSIEGTKIIHKYYTLQNNLKLEEYNEITRRYHRLEYDLRLTPFSINPEEKKKKIISRLRQSSPRSSDKSDKSDTPAVSKNKKSFQEVIIIPFTNDINKYGKDPKYTMIEFLKDLRLVTIDIIISRAPYCIFHEPIDNSNVQYKLFYANEIESYCNDNFFKRFNCEIQLNHREASIN